MMFVEFASEAEARAAVAAEDARRGYPRREQHIGAGRHVDLDDGSRVGWTITISPVLVHEDGTAAIVADADLAAQMGRGLSVQPEKWRPLMFAAGGEP